MSRSDRSRSRAGAPVRLLHLGLGNFFRAHQCWYTDQAADGADWPIAAFTGTWPGTTPLVRELQSQDGLFTLIERAPDGDHLSVIRSLRHAHAAEEAAAWLGYFRSPRLGAVTLTVTEAGYPHDPAGGLDLARPGIADDLATLRRDLTGTVRSATGRLLAGLAARQRADAGPLALVPCDNIAGNGPLLQRIVTEAADHLSSPLAQWVSESVTVVSTMVDRITPRVTAADLAVVGRATALADRCPVVTEPFHEWVLHGEFPAGRPQWETAGATFVDDVVPYENRKLWLLNGAHSLLAYAGSIRGHTTVSEAAADDRCLAWVLDWWAVASPHLMQTEPERAAYSAALLERFGNGRMHDSLDRIAADGSKKLPIRILSVLHAERAAGRLPLGATRVLAAWICHLRGMGGAVDDVAGAGLLTLAEGSLVTVVPRLLDFLESGLGADVEVVAAVVAQCGEFRA